MHDAAGLLAARLVVVDAVTLASEDSGLVTMALSAVSGIRAKARNVTTAVIQQ
jgi:hypothetical protein